MRYYILVLCTLLFPFVLSAQTDKEPYAAQWKKADSLIQAGFPESAAKIARSIYDRARQKNESVQMIKAQLVLMSADFQRNEDAFREAIGQAEEQAASTSFPNNAIWQSIAAQLYWTYYQQNRWKLLDRNSTAGPVGDDFEQWDANRFFEKVSSLYQASLQRAGDLEKISIDDYDPILEKGVNTRHLRPTLFDLLAFRALAFYQHPEKDLTRPAFAFIMNDAAAFAPSDEFVKTKFETSDSLSMQWQALKLYQRILSLHSDDSHKDALLDADLHRLQFAYEHSVHPDKKELYRKALERIEKNYRDNPLSALAGVRLVQLMMPVESTRGQQDEQLPRVETKPSVLPVLRQRLEAIAASYPESEGGQLAKQLLQNILIPQLQITAEGTVLPGEPSRILIQYRNTSRATVRLLRLPVDSKWRTGVFQRRTAKPLNELRSQPYIFSKQVELPASQDHEQHSTELMLEALGTGYYAVLISGNEDFTEQNNMVSYAVFQVSGLSVVQSGDKGYVLNRKTGEPVPEVSIDFFRHRYNDQIRGQELVLTNTVQTDRTGSFAMPSDMESRGAIRARKGKDSLMLSGYFARPMYPEQSKLETQTFFFTDRAIYRPGQSIFFKGIMVQKEKGGRKNEVLANRSSEVTLYDVNGQKISSQTFTTNEYGSFSGSFTAPEGLLNGNMRIASKTGGVDFSVEEYKRPRFLVSFDTLREAYRLNETIRISGKAMAYAGNPVGEGQVRYRVVRQTRFPYWWLSYRWGYPQSPAMEVSNGVAQTKADGSFEISFKAIPDLSIDSSSLPVFSYTVSADITDINGETRSGSTNIQVGYTAIQLILQLPAQAGPADLDTIIVNTRNLNDRFVPTDTRLRIVRLQAPEQVLRKRLWAVPDQFLMDSLNFKKNFPRDVYRYEDNHLYWPEAEVVTDRAFTSTESGRVALPQKTWNRNGWYLLEVSASDREGRMLTERKYVQVWTPDQEGRTNTPLMVVPVSHQKEPGQLAGIYAVSGYERLHLLRKVTNAEQKEDAQLRVLDGRADEWTKTITEADRGGVLVQYLAVKENRLYKQQAYVHVPWTNKELEISWETHRDKLLPGSKETWTMVVRGKGKDKVAAEMVATLYDASLDAFRPHSWRIFGLYPTSTAHENWTGHDFLISQGIGLAYPDVWQQYQYEKRYDQLALSVYGGSYDRRMYKTGDVAYSVRSGVANQTAAPEAMAVADPVMDADAKGEEAQAIAAEQKGPDVIVPRTNLQETAFFYPHLKTDPEGNIRIEFTIPEALTEWKLLGLAHTRDLKYGMVEGAVKTQKDLMVTPNLPRFLRQGDEIVVSAKISSLANADLTGTATLEILNAITMKPMDLPFRLEQKEQSFGVEAGQSTIATWKLHVPESLYEPVIIRVLARAGNFTDGEDNILPVISNRMLVTETLPLWLHGDGSKSFSFDKLKHADTSSSLVHQALTLEYTGNPAWYAVQSLPYLMEYPYECAEQVFNRYYASALAAHIVAQSPKIKAIFDKWKEEAMFSSFASPLSRNQELKSALLEETPWVLEANNEAEQRKRLGQLFDTYKLSGDLARAMRQLSEMQRPDGSFPWFRGMHADRYITQYIVTGLARLQHLGVKTGEGPMTTVIDNALRYLDEQVVNDYERLKTAKVKLEDQHIGYYEIQYLYMRSFLKQEPGSAARTVQDYYRGQAVKYWSKFNPYMKGMIALALHRNKDQKTPGLIIQSLRETAIRKEEMGMYWMQPGSSYWWYEAPIEAQALLIETFKEVVADQKAVDAMKIWLLKNKQTQSWETTKATADACYALLLSGTDWLMNEPVVRVSLGDTTFSSTAVNKEAGTGYFKVRIPGTQVQPADGDIKLTVSGNANNTSWGAVYWQYFEDLDKISGAKTPLEIRKQLFIEKNTSRGPQLQPVTADNPLRIGDKLVVRLEIISDRDMEYVHLKDMRASAFEPVNVISAYKWQGGLGYYESTRDVSTNFFFDRLKKGKYVFEYPVTVQQAGSFSNGIATIQCMYAPEFSSHSEGIRIRVQP